MPSSLPFVVAFRDSRFEGLEETAIDPLLPVGRLRFVAQRLHRRLGECNDFYRSWSIYALIESLLVKRSNKNRNGRSSRDALYSRKIRIRSSENDRQ